jgi:hypothetical protein
MEKRTFDQENISLLGEKKVEKKQNYKNQFLKAKFFSRVLYFWLFKIIFVK